MVEGPLNRARGCLTVERRALRRRAETAALRRGNPSFVSLEHPGLDAATAPSAEAP